VSPDGRSTPAQPYKPHILKEIHMTDEGSDETGTEAAEVEITIEPGQTLRIIPAGAAEADRNYGGHEEVVISMTGEAQDCLYVMPEWVHAASSKPRDQT
jgi:hypothetical protein